MRATISISLPVETANKLEQIRGSSPRSAFVAQVIERALSQEPKNSEVTS